MARTTWTATQGKIFRQVENGTPAHFLVKGVCYKPTPIGKGETWDATAEDNAALWRRDLTRIRRMGANSIRIFGMNTAPGAANLFLEKTWNWDEEPLYVFLSVWIDPGTFASADKTAQAVESYKAIAREYVDHPGVMGFTIGSEFNDAADNAARSANPAEYWQRFVQLASELRAIVGGKKLVSTAAIESFGENGFLRGAINSDARDLVDVWGVTLYKEKRAFGSAWDDYTACFPAGTTPKPLLVMEFVVPASRHVGDKAEDLPPGNANATMGKVTDYLADVWRTIASKGCGGFVFEWTDEWWKAGNPDSHDKSDASATGFFPEGGGYLDQEWFGLNAVRKASPDELLPRAAYRLFRWLWNDMQEVIIVVYPSGPQQELHYVVFNGSKFLVHDEVIPNAWVGPRQAYGVTYDDSDSGQLRAMCGHAKGPASETIGLSTFVAGSWRGEELDWSGPTGRIGFGNVLPKEHRMFVFQHQDGRLHYWWGPGKFPMNAYSSGGVAVEDLDRKIVCLHRANDPSGRLFRTTFSNDWDADTALDNIRLKDTPAVARDGSKLLCVFRAYHDSFLWYTTLTATTCDTAQKLETRGAGTPALARLGDTIYCFYQPEGTTQLRYRTWRNGAWTSVDELIDGVTLSGTAGPAAATLRRG